MNGNTFNELAQLTALAERLADEGQMNLNKMMEAAVFARIRRAGWQYYPNVTRDSMLDELGSAIEALKRDSTSPELVAAMEVGMRALQSSRGGDMLRDESPDVFVCRTCGHTALGQAPDRCPNCGSWHGRFRKFVAFFNRDNIEPLDPSEVIDLLAENGNELARLVDGLSEEMLNHKASEDIWSLREHISHFYDAQVYLLDPRVDLMLNHENPDLAAMAVYEFASEEDRHGDTPQEMLESFLRKREKTVKLLREIPFADFYRSGQHPEFGELTVLRQVAYLAFHEQVHLAEIEALRQEVVGL